MAQARLHAVARQLRSLVAARNLTETADGPLLERFIAQRDEAAFAALLRRHGPMVLAVGRRILHHDQDAEDVFQAAFLLLAKQAQSIRKRESVGCWLHGVAHRLAIRVKTQAANRQTRERKAAAMRGTRSGGEAAWDELQAILDEELARLPANYRSAIILCCLEGKTQEEAAHHLGCPLGTVRSRLARGRDLLHKHLTARGLTLSAASLATALTGAGVSAARTVLVGPTLQAALLVAAGRAPVEVVTPSVAALVDAGMTAMSGMKTKIAIGLLLAASLVGTVVGYQLSAIRETPQGKPDRSAIQPTAESRQPKADLYGDALPEGAVARMGTVRFRLGGNVGQIAFSANSKILAAASGDNVISLWDAATGKELRQIENATNGSSVATSPNGKVLVTGYGTDLRRWDMAGGKELPRFALKGPNAEHLLFSPDGKTLAVIGRLHPQNQNLVLFLDAETGNELHRKLGQKDYIAPSLAIAPDSKTWAYADGKEKEIWLFETRTGKEVGRLTGADSQPRAVAFAPDGKTLASVHSGGESHFWDLATGKLSARQGRFGIGSLQIAYSPDGKFLAGEGIGPKPNLYDLSRGENRYPGPRLFSGNPSVVFSPNGRLLATSGGNVIRVWDMVAERPVWPWDGHQGDVESVGYVLNGKVLVSTVLGNMGNYHLWETATGKELTELEQEHAVSNHVGQAAPDKVSRVGVSALVSSPDGKMLVIGTVGSGAWGTICLVDAATGKEIRRLEEEKNSVQGLAISANGRTIASQHLNTICVWDVSTGKKLRSFPCNARGQNNIALSPDAKTVALGDYIRGVIQIWDVASGKEARRLAAHERAVYGVVFSPDGTKLASVGDGKAVILWDWATGKKLQRMEGHESYVRFAVFSPDGRSILTGGIDKTVRVWEVASGGERQRFVGHRSYVICGAFSPDGRQASTGSSDTTVLVWDLFGGGAGSKGTPQPLQDLETLLPALENADARVAFRASVALISAGDRCLRLLKKRLSPVDTPNAERLGALLADLDSEQFAVRTKAARQLEELGEAARPGLHKLLDNPPSEEARRRAEQILAKLEGSPRLRAVRVVEVLEHIATPEARDLLRKLAAGAAEARLTHEAKAALERLAKR